MGTPGPYPVVIQTNLAMNVWKSPNPRKRDDTFWGVLRITYCMAPCAFSVRETVECDVTVSGGNRAHLCRAIIDADFWRKDSVPVEFGGFLSLPKWEWEALASSERLVLTLKENGEPYRMILDAITGRFVARQL